MEKIIVKKIEVEKNDIRIDYKVTEGLKKYFNLENKFHVHYYEDISTVPEEVAVIPFVSNVLPIIWLTNSELVIDSLEEKYANSLDKTRMAFNKMYKTDIFKGKVTVKKKKRIKPLDTEENISVFYSGGVDSTSSLVSCLENNKRPLLITIWGTDVWDNNIEGFESLKKNAEDCGKKYNLKNMFIKTNFRKFIYEHELTKDLLTGKINDSWWRGIQHGIGLIGHVAPYAYTKNIKLHYIPATLNSNNIGSTCGSFPTIDESVKYMNCSICHEGYELDRLDKVNHITSYFEKQNETFPLRVCYMDKGSKLNCCQCEKCYLTIMELISLKKDPNKWGFTVNKETMSDIPKYLYEKASDSPINVEIWNRIKQEMDKNKKVLGKHKELDWIYKYTPEQAYIIRLPKLSVIVPVYNTGKYLEKCLDSLLSQDYQNLEIIVVEDCSTDNSREVLKKYNKEKKIKIFYNAKNSGLSFTRNTGLKYATGKYIGYIDSDDYVDNNYYSTMMSKVINDNADVVVCDMKTVDENENNREVINRCYDIEQDKLGFVNTGLAASACNKVFKRELIEKYEFSVGKVNEDLAVVLPALINANKVSYADGIYYYYIQRNNSIQNSRFSDKRFDIFYGVDLTLKRIENCENYDKISQAIIYNQIIVLLIYVIPKEKNISRRYNILKKFNKLSQKYEIRRNIYFWRFLEQCGKKHRIYYKALFKLNCQNLYLFSNLLISSYDFAKNIKSQKTVIKDVDKNDLIEMSKKQKKLKAQDIKISVVVPNYNYEKFLYQRLYSILYQKVKLHEIIILDDCSKDNSRDLIDDIVDTLSPYINIKKIYNDTNSGSAFKQWHKGLNITEGDYVWIAEADDYCTNKFLKTVITPIKSNSNIVISYCDTAFINTEGNIILKSIKPEIDIQKTGHWDKSYINSGIDEIKNYSYLNCTIANVSSCLIKNGDYSKYLKESGNYKQAGDWLFYINVIKNGNIAYSNKVYNYYRVHGNNVSSTMNRKKHIDEINKIHQYVNNEFKLTKKHEKKMKERIKFLTNVWGIKNEK